MQSSQHRISWSMSHKIGYDVGHEASDADVGVGVVVVVVVSAAASSADNQLIISA
jgi:hypothetical protein